MSAYICKKCGKDLGELGNKLLGPDYASDMNFQLLLTFHEKIHWKGEVGLWTDLLQAARDVIGNGRGTLDACGLQKLAGAVEALKDAKC